jgi:hypothetical protein
MVNMTDALSLRDVGVNHMSLIEERKGKNLFEGREEEEKKGRKPPTPPRMYGDSKKRVRAVEGEV